MLNNELWQKPGAAAGGAGFYTYQIANSCRFDGSTSKLTKTWGSVGTDDNKKGISVWIKRTNNEFGSVTDQKFFSSASPDLNAIWFDHYWNADSFGMVLSNGGVGGFTNAKFRDPSAWIHVVYIYNSDESTATDRIKVYFNGVYRNLTDSGGQGGSPVAGTFWNLDGAGSVLYPGSGVNCGYGKNGNANHIGNYQNADNNWFYGQMADFIMIDGAAVIGDFGEFKNGVWIPKDPSGLTFGNNGFHLDFADSTAFGNDVSGNNHDWTVAGIVASDQLLDSPTFGSEGSANFATLGPLWKTPDMTFSEGNLKWSTSTNQRGVMSNWSVPLEGKFYWEYIPTAWGGSAGDDQWCGVNQSTIDFTASRGGKVTGYSYGANVGNKQILGAETSYGDAWTTNDKIGVAVDRVNDTIQFYKNNSGQGTFAISATADLFPWIGSGGGSNAASGTFNFGADGTFAGLVTAGGNADENGYGNFFYAPPSGFLALCAANLPTADAVDPAQTDDNYPQKLFAPKLYTGDGAATLTISGMDLQPDMTWIKNRDAADDSCVFDTSRGVTKLWHTNNSDPETTEATSLKSWTSDGFTTGSLDLVNTSAEDYASWNWRMNGGTTSSNALGDVTSTVQVDPTGNMSIITYTGTGIAGNTVGHGLSQAPDFFIVNQLNGGNNRIVAARAYPDNAHDLRLDVVGAGGGASVFPAGQSFDNVTSTLWPMALNSPVNGSTNTYVGYFFTNCEGFIKSGTYEGNANASGTFVHTGFRPALIICKSYDSTSDWFMYDDSRVGFNVENSVLWANEPTAEAATVMIDILSNGFKLRIATDPNVAETYFYMAFAHNPFQYATAR